MDSTFLGFLAGFGLKLNQATPLDKPGIKLLNPNARTRPSICGLQTIVFTRSIREAAPPVVAHVKVGHFCGPVSLVTDIKASGPLKIVFRPELGEIGLPHTGTKAKFNEPA